MRPMLAGVKPSPVSSSPKPKRRSSIDAALEASFFTALVNSWGAAVRHKQLDSKSDKSFSIDLTNLVTRSPTNSRDAIIPTPAMQRMPMRMFSPLLEMMSNADTGANAAGTPTIAVVYPDNTQAYAQSSRRE